MNKILPITTLFVDVGEVLLTNGWDHHARKRAATHFHLDWPQMEERHGLVFETHEEGKMTFEEYLDQVVFYQSRTFTRQAFRAFMCHQSKPYPDMLDLMAELKLLHSLKVVVVSNESREINAYRIRTFKLDALVDVFISSCFVHTRKPDSEMFRLALDVAQALPAQVIYIDNTAMFVEIATGLGIRSILHTDYASTRAELECRGLSTNRPRMAACS